MTLTEILLVATNALAVGAAWNNLKNRDDRAFSEIASIKSMLGNGEPGVFVRKAELELIRDEGRREHASYEHRLDALEKSE
jgi:hypothetical protein